jgi:hypothetical protein
MPASRVRKHGLWIGELGLLAPKVFSQEPYPNPPQAHVAV